MLLSFLSFLCISLYALFSAFCWLILIFVSFIQLVQELHHFHSVLYVCFLLCVLWKRLSTICSLVNCIRLRRMISPSSSQIIYFSHGICFLIWRNRAKRLQGRVPFHISYQPQYTPCCLINIFMADCRNTKFLLLEFTDLDLGPSSLLLW